MHRCQIILTDGATNMLSPILGSNLWLRDSLWGYRQCTTPPGVFTKTGCFSKNPTTFDDLNNLTIFQALSKNPKASQKNSDPKRSTPAAFNENRPFNDDPPVKLKANKTILTLGIPTERLCDGRVSSLRSWLKHRKGRDSAKFLQHPHPTSHHPAQATLETVFLRKKTSWSITPLI